MGWQSRRYGAVDFVGRPGFAEPGCVAHGTRVDDAISEVPATDLASDAANPRRH